MSNKLRHPLKPCPECPWRTDVEPGRFDRERFEALAATTYDMAQPIFQCHKTTDEKPAACAGFLLRGAMHNLSIRLGISQGVYDPTKVTDGGYPMFKNYREMAIANGVDPDDPVLRPCRSNGYD